MLRAVPSAGVATGECPLKLVPGTWCRAVSCLIACFAAGASNSNLEHCNRRRSVPPRFRRRAPSRPTRRDVPLASLDAYRGAIMLYMASDGRGITQVAQNVPGPVWQSLTWWFDHVAWTGCSTWDLIQPAFMFMVGIAVPFSYARRSEQGDSFRKQFGHALVRAAVLILLTVFLASESGGGTATRWEFTNVLGQIGSAIRSAALPAQPPVLRAGARVAGAILAGYWAFFALYPLPAAGFNYAAVGVLRPTFPQRGASKVSSATGTRTATSPPRSTSGS